MNQRRMIWLENDLELMMKLIHADIMETVRSQVEIATDHLLKTESEALMDGVANGINQQISTFHLKLEDVLKENQRLLKLREPPKFDRYI